MLTSLANMVSTSDEPAPLKAKLSQVKTLLQDADRILNGEATKNEIFATRSSATATTTSSATANGSRYDLLKTLDDIGILKSVLSCPIFNKIVNVTDSLDKLAYHVNLHPSIGPSDINIDNNGELILAPPMEPTSLNNLINSQIDGFSELSNNSPNFMSPSRGPQLSIGDQDQQPILHNNNNEGCPNVPYLIGQYENSASLNREDIVHSSQNPPRQSQGYAFDTRPIAEAKKIPCSRELYQTEGHTNVKGSLNQRDRGNGYKVTNPELRTNSTNLSGPNNPSTNNIVLDSSRKKMHQPFPTSNGKSQAVISPTQLNRTSCSPSNSVGSTVRMAEDCDSGASSYQSHCAKNTPCLSLPYKSIEPISETLDDQNQTVGHEVHDYENDQYDDPPPGMETIKVTLQKDDNGLGINVAGYTYEDGEISGVFIKSITPGSAADRCGKLRNLDQVLTVDGRMILDLSNAEAISLLKRTGRSVTLEVMRCVSEHRFKRLREALSKVPEDMGLAASNEAELSHEPNCGSGVQTDTSLSSKSSPIGDSNRTGLFKAKPTFIQVSGQMEECTTEESCKNEIVSRFLEGSSDASNSVPKNDHFDISLSNDSYMSNLSLDLNIRMPIAAQRGATINKVIEMKQGATNTIDIRSPLCQTVAPTHVDPKVAKLDRGLGTWKDFDCLELNIKPEWEKETNIIELYKDGSQGLGFTVKDYENPYDRSQSIFMVTSITPGGVADQDERLEKGDLLIFVDDTNLEGATFAEMTRALKRASGQVRLGVLKLKRAP